MKEANERKNSTPLISIIIPCYNVERYIDRCLESVINQTYKNLEIILIDDGSPDDSGKKCDYWAKKDKRITVIHQKNTGLGLARNAGLKAAHGEYIAFIDSDDYIDCTMYEKLYLQAVSSDSDIVYCGHIKQMNDGSDVLVKDFEDVEIFERDELVELSQSFFKPSKRDGKMLTMSVWHSIYKRSVINQQFYSEREVGSEDIHFQICAMLNSSRVSFIPDTLYIYCYNGESLSHTFKLDKFDRYKRLRQIINDTYANYGVNFPADYCVFMMAFAMVRRISLSNNNRIQKQKLISHIVDDSFWDEDHVDVSELDFIKKIFYRCLNTHSKMLMYILSELYSFVNYKLRKKPLQ